MSLPLEPVFSKLKNEFVVGWRNIITQKYVGESAGYTCDQTAVGTTNGAGPHNVQIFVLAPDLTVLHCLPGFWHPDDLAQELDLAQRLLRVWNNRSLSRQQKNAQFTRMQLAAFEDHSRKTTARSGWQGFDAANEQKRVEAGQVRDTMLTSTAEPAGAEQRGRRKRPKMKPLNQLVHERIAARPFVAYDEFDTAKFADYGRILYDNNRRVDGRGETFMTPRKVEKEEARLAKREAMSKRRQEAMEKRRAQQRSAREARMAALTKARKQRLKSPQRHRPF